MYHEPSAAAFVAEQIHYHPKHDQYRRAINPNLKQPRLDMISVIHTEQFNRLERFGDNPYLNFGLPNSLKHSHDTGPLAGFNETKNFEQKVRKTRSFGKRSFSLPSFRPSVLLFTILRLFLSTEQLRQRLAGGQFLWAAEHAVQFQGQIQAEAPEHGRRQVARRGGASAFAWPLKRSLTR